MANITSVDYKNPPFALGDNFYEEATVTVPSGGLERGTILVRDTSTNKFAVATALTLVNGAGIAILREDVENTTASAADVHIRVMISGHVNRGLLAKIGDTALTDVQADILRGQGFIVEKVAEV